MIRRWSLLVMSLVMLLNGRAWGADSLTLLPSQVVLTGSEARQRLLVQATAGAQVIGQVTEGVVMTRRTRRLPRLKRESLSPSVTAGRQSR